MNTLDAKTEANAERARKLQTILDVTKARIANARERWARELERIREANEASGRW